jgi:hypothetical protein
LQRRNLVPFRRKPLILAVAIAIFLVIAITAGVALFFSPLLTNYVESDAFREKMEEETAKGLHFPRAVTRVFDGPAYLPRKVTGSKRTMDGRR